MFKKRFHFNSSKHCLPIVPKGKVKSRAFLAVYRNVYYIGHLHINGMFYLFNNVGAIKCISVKDAEIIKDDEVFWAFT